MEQSVISTFCKISLFVLLNKIIFTILFVLWFLVEGRIPDFWKGQFIWILGKGVRSTSVILNMKIELWRDLELCSNESLFLSFFFFLYPGTRLVYISLLLHEENSYELSCKARGIWSILNSLIILDCYELRQLKVWILETVRGWGIGVVWGRQRTEAQRNYKICPTKSHKNPHRASGNEARMFFLLPQSLNSYISKMRTLC